MKRIKIILAVLLSAATLFAVGCETAAPPDTGTAAGSATEPVTETEPVEEDTRLSVDFSVKGGVYQSAQTLVLSLPENLMALSMRL